KIYEYQLLLVKLFSNQVTPPQQQVNILSPGLRGLMLEDFPGNANGYYRLEQGKTNRDAILLEDGILQQQEVVAPPEQTFKPDVIEILCPPATTPDSNTDMFSVGNCSPPLDLLSFPEGYDQMYFLVRGADEYYTSDTARALDPDSPLVKVFTHIGSNNYNTINQNNKWRVLINFNMYLVPFDPKNVGPWDYVAIDTTSYKYNKNENVETEILDPEAGAASGSNTDTDSSSGTNNYYIGSKTGKLNGCFEQKDFLVYIKFEKIDHFKSEPDAFFNNTKAEEYRLKFQEGDPQIFGDVYDINGCYLYQLVNPGSDFEPGPQDKEGGTTLPVI
ncbi:MAG: hypothetical protein V3W20_10020, partial [Candidatus Neomarinimicrobiota bacterium]